MSLEESKEAKSMELPDMTDAETVAHLREWVKSSHGLFAWPTDVCGYRQHMRFVVTRNEEWEGKAAEGMEFNDFILEYADRLERGEIDVAECAECGQIGGNLIKCSRCGNLLCDPWCHIDGKCGERCWHAGEVRKAMGLEGEDSDPS